MSSDIENAQDQQEEKYYDKLAEHVMTCFDEARQHKVNSGVENNITESLRRYLGTYSDEESCKFGDILTYLNITGELCQIAANWLKNSYFSAQDRPWTLEPTPEPELPDDLQAQLEQSVAVQLKSMLTSRRPGEISQRNNLIKELRNTASFLAMRFATERTKSMARLIEDQMEEADWNARLFDFLLDVVIYPSAILKGPILTRKLSSSPTETAMKFKERDVLEVRRVEPINLYPSPDSSNPQDGSYMIERMPTSRSELLRAKKLKGFDAEAVDYVISESVKSGTKTIEPGVQVSDNDDAELKAVKNNTKYMLDVYEFRGAISGADIIQWTDPETSVGELLEDFSSSVEIGDWGTISPHMDYESVVWVCNGVTIMARIARSEPIPYRPYYVTSMYKIPGAFWGTSIPMKIASMQDEINNAARARTLNSSMSSGPIVEIDKSRFPDNDIPASLMPWDHLITQTNSVQGNNNARAVTFEHIPNIGSQLTAIINDNWERCYRITGITPQMAGLGSGTHRTLGAYSLQYSSATKGIQAVVANIDHDVIEKLITQMYYWNMVYHEDETIKGDVKVKIRGAAGLIAQEQKQSRPLELLQSLGPILAQMQPQTALALANKVLVESGFDPAELGASDGLPEQEAANTYGLANNQPQVDGRSGGVGEQLQNEKLPPGPQR